MEQFERIRREHREEEVSIRGLARRHKVHRRAVRQALASAVPPPRKPVESRAQPAIGPHAATIRAWLTEDKEAPRKQRHTARRVWERLVDEHAADVAESTVRRYVRACRRELHLDHVVIALPRLGGVPAQIRYDNARALVARVLRGRNRRETEPFIALRSHYGFDSFYCEPGEKGVHEKGGIEPQARGRRPP